MRSKRRILAISAALTTHPSSVSQHIIRPVVRDHQQEHHQCMQLPMSDVSLMKLGLIVPSAVMKAEVPWMLPSKDPGTHWIDALR